MKKLISICLILVSMVLASQAQLNKVAVISVYGSRNLSDNPLETKLYEAIMKDSSFNLNPIVTKFDVTIREKFVPQFPFPFLTKEEVVNAPGYKDLANVTKYMKEDWRFTAAKDYVPIASFGIIDDTEAIKKSFELLPADVEGVMVCFIEFNIYDAVGVGGMSSKKVYAYVNTKIFNRDGKMIFKLKERASSSKGVMAVGGIITDIKKVMPMVTDAADRLFEDMQEKLPKSLAKMAKRIDKVGK